MENQNRAVDDAECTAHIFLKMCVLLEEKDIHDIDKANEAGKMSENIAVSACPVAYQGYFTPLAFFDQCDPVIFVTNCA